MAYWIRIENENTLTCTEVAVDPVEYIAGERLVKLPGSNRSHALPITELFEAIPPEFEDYAKKIYIQWEESKETRETFFMQILAKYRIKGER